MPRAMGSGLVAALGMVAVAAGAVLEWVEARFSFFGQGGEFSFKGSDIAQGKVLVVLGIAGAGAGLIAALIPAARRALGVAVVAAASVAVGFAGTDIADVGRATEFAGVPTDFPTDFPTEFPTDFPTDFPFPDFPTELPTSPSAAVRQQEELASFGVDIGIGLWLVLGGGVAALLAGLVVAFPRSPTRPAAPEPPPAPPA